MQTDRASSEDATRAGAVLAWDAPTRLFHWALVVLIGLAYVSRHWGDVDLVWHKWNGYAVLSLIVWRVLWGLVGTSTSRFASFVAWPWTAARYGVDFLLRRPRAYLGHNPLGGLVVLVMLALVGGIGVLGLFSYDDHTSLVGGPLSSRVPDDFVVWATAWHLRLFDVLLWVIGLHLAANVLYLVWRRENLIQSMITGKKRAAAFEDQPAARVAGAGRALACLAISVAIVLGGIWLAGGRIL